MEPFTQVNVAIENAPSQLARLADVLRANDVNIDAITCSEGQTHTTVHIIPSDAETAKIVLKDIGKVSTTNAVGFKMKNKPGAISIIGRACAAAGLNIGMIYATTCGKEAMVYVTVNDNEHAIEKLEEWEKRAGKICG